MFLNQEFEEIFKRIGGDTLLTKDRLFNLFQFARRSINVPGDIAEVGVYKGGSSRLLADAAPSKTVRVFDTFSGIPNAQESIDEHKVGDFTLGGEVPALLNAANIIVYKGIFPQTAAGARFSLAHFDGDTYRSAIDFIEFFWPRLSPLGVLVFDDYKWHNCPGVEKAVLEFFCENHVLQFTENQAVILK